MSAVSFTGTREAPATSVAEDADELLQPHLGELRHPAPLVDAVEGQDVLHEEVQPVRGLDDARGVVAHLGRAAGAHLQRLRQQPDGGQGRAQLVGDGGHEVALELQEAVLAVLRQPASATMATASAPQMATSIVFSP